MPVALDRDKIWKDFHEAVNMTASEIAKWLDTDESRGVGQRKGGATESTGHASGRRIVSILKSRKAELDDDDYRHMRKVVGYIRRHRAQEPANVATSRWRYSLMNWGFDPLK